MATPPGPHDPRTAQPNALPSIEVGTRLTDYASLDLTVEGGAEGGYGLVVWGPNQATGGQRSALKLLRPDLLARAEAQSASEGERLRREFEREALTWCHLWAHATIITANALTRLPGWDNLPVLDLEYAPSGSLRHMLTKAHSSQAEHLSLRSALAWGQQIAAALAVIHQPDLACERPEPLVHCDLKPENVLLNAQGWAKLTDLGLTRAYAATALGAAGAAAASPSDAADVAQSGEAVGSERSARLARMRAALQAAGLLSTYSNDPTVAAIFAAKGDVTLGAARDAGFQTRSVRVPPISAALLATVLAPPPIHSVNVGASPVAVGSLAQTEPGIGSHGPVAGTPPYMAPEQWWGLDAVTPASDVYALGVLLFELFAGGRWSPQQQRWLEEDRGDAANDATAAPDVGERYVPFPHAPQFNAEALAYLEGWGGPTGQQAYFAAWYAAHRAGPRWRLADPAVGALTRGPLVDAAATGSRDAHAARQTLAALSELVERCLAPEAAQRPTAGMVQRQLGEIARLVGEEPLMIPEIFPRTPEHEAMFWENLALTYGNLGQHEEQLRMQRQVVALDPENPQRWANLGVAFADLQRHNEALAAYGEAERRLTPAYQKRAPQRAAQLALSIPSNQGVSLKNLGRYEEGVAVYRRVLALRPDWADTRFNLALALLLWSAVAGATREQRLERLHTARLEAQRMLADAPGMAQGPALLANIERALARLE